MLAGWSKKRRERIRMGRARWLWKQGWGETLGFSSFESYLATIPPIPERPAACPTHLNRVLLWDVRPCIHDGVASLARACALLGMPAFEGIDRYAHHATPDQLGTSVQWIWCQDGGRYRERNPQECRDLFDEGEVGLCGLGGLLLCRQYGRRIIEEPYDGSGRTRRLARVHLDMCSAHMDLPGAVHPRHPETCLSIAIPSNSDDDAREIPTFSVCFNDAQDDSCGSASRWR